jgi:hypothetical protein
MHLFGLAHAGREPGYKKTAHFVIEFVDQFVAYESVVSH